MSKSTPPIPLNHYSISAHFIKIQKQKQIALKVYQGKSICGRTSVLEVDVFAVIMIGYHYHGEKRALVLRKNLEEEKLPGQYYFHKLPSSR